MQQSPVESTDDWSSCISFSVADRDPRRLFWIGPLLLGNPFLADSSAAQVKALRLAEPLLAQWSWRGLCAGDKIIEYFSAVMTDPSKAVRDQIAIIFAMIAVNSFDPLRHVPASSPVHSPTLGPLLSTVVQATPAPSILPGGHPAVLAFIRECIVRNETVTGEDAVRFRLTVLSILGVTANHNSGSALVPLIDEVLPFFLRLQDESDPNVLPVARNSLDLLAIVFSPQPLMATLMRHISEASVHSSWHVRAAVSHYGQMFIYQHCFYFPLVPFDFVEPLLTDAQVEVQNIACSALSSFLRLAEPTQVPSLLQRFLKLAAVAIGKRQRDSESVPAKNSEEYQSLLRRRHAGVLGLAALTYAYPYDVPSWMPEVMAVICKRRGDPMPIRSTVSKCCAEFWRTHKDMWHLFKPLFNEDQLEAVSELLNPYNYYA
eukprot:GILI01020862.1.p1 GENE.GILI01020862.1~~GILI01020862.1.p1  ORF type:complete len:493 (+),score=137.66 GILI01020862.1:187-1479(+)